jgi:hypothetical protein
MMRLIRTIAIGCVIIVTGCGGGPPVQPPAPAPTPTPTSIPQPDAPEVTLSRQDVLRARRQYKVQVLSFDASQGFGVEEPLSDLVRIRITNGSKLALPCLTITTKRYANGRMVLSSRAPSIPTKDLAPGDSVDYDYYPRGHLTVARVDRVTVEIEGIIDPDAEEFFCELQGRK